MKLTIITITYNNIEGLCRTIQSVQSQTFCDFEHIIVDGGSTDGSVELIREYADNQAVRLSGCKANQASDTLPHALITSRSNCVSAYSVRWISEPDNGIYDAQNKGILMAQGEYCYFLNAGDTFCDENILQRMMINAYTDIVYGNEVLIDEHRTKIGIAYGIKNPSFLHLYKSCMKHQASFICRNLFETYGVYDVDMRICADWDWFLRVIGFNDVTLEYRNVDVAYFDTNGYSYTHPEIERYETELILNRYMPSQLMQKDYELFSRYAYIKIADKNPILRFFLRVIMKLAKLQQQWQLK